MSLKAPTVLNSLIADYLYPGEAVRMMAGAETYEDVAFITVDHFATSQKVAAYLKTFNMQNYLLFFSTKLVQPNEQYDKILHFSDKVEDLLKGYKAICTLIATLNVADFQSNRNFGYGYVRPQVTFLHPFRQHGAYIELIDRRINEVENDAAVIENGPLLWGVQSIVLRTQLYASHSFGTDVETDQTAFDQTEGLSTNGVEDTRLMPYAATRDPEVAEETARMLSESGIKATPAMKEAAATDNQNGVAAIIREQEEQK